MARVTIGVPVYNGAALLAEALTCLQQQTFSDLAVIVRDNGSTDGSGAIAQSFAARDSRFSVLRVDATVPALDNFRAVLQAARSPLFAWRAYDDLSSPDYVERLVAALDARPDAWLATGDIETRKAHRGTLRVKPVPAMPAGETLGVLRLMGRAQASWYYGLWRHDVIARLFDDVARRYGHLWANDHATLFPVLLRRAVAFAPGTSFVQRLGFDPGRPPRAYQPAPDQAVAVTRALWRVGAAMIGEAEIGRSAKMAAYAALPGYVNKRAFRVTRLARLWLEARRRPDLTNC